MSLLSEILRHKKEEIARRKKEGLSGTGIPSIGKHRLSTALRRKEVHQSLNLICEIKRASPSAGAFDLSLTPAALAAGYEAAGAAAISVVTDKAYFAGDLDLLGAVRRSVSCPLLLKDFVIDRFQVEEASFLGASGVLLIARILGDSELKDLTESASSLGIDVIAEVHGEEELKRVLRFEDVIVGINNRDLDTLEVDLETTFRLIGKVGGGRITVSESGISTREEIERLEKTGLDAALVGTSLLKSRNPFEKVRELRGDRLAG